LRILQKYIVRYSMKNNFKFGRGFVELDPIPLDFFNRIGEIQERRVFTIPVGNIRDEYIEDYIRDIVGQIRRGAVIETNNNFLIPPRSFYLDEPTTLKTKIIKQWQIFVTYVDITISMLMKYMKNIFVRSSR